MMKKNLATIFMFAGLFLLGACSDKQHETISPDTETGAQPDAPHTAYQVMFKKVSAPRGITDFVLQLPADYSRDPQKKWPVIIFLHGIGERGSDLNIVKRAGLAGRASADPAFPFIVVSPQCKADGWWNVSDLDAVFADVKQLSNVDLSRVYLTGLSMGGFGTWDWANVRRANFAAIVPICGGGTPSQACNMKTLPVWVFHNADDPTVNVSGSRDMVNALKSCGNTLVKYTENPTGGHDAWTRAYNDPALYKWLLQNKL
ncbi:carboxylesterase family protein [Chitinophaga lutea]